MWKLYSWTKIYMDEAISTKVSLSHRKLALTNYGLQAKSGLHVFVVVILIDYFFKKKFRFTKKLIIKYRELPYSSSPCPTVSPIINIFHYCGTFV